MVAQGKGIRKNIKGATSETRNGKTIDKDLPAEREHLREEIVPGKQKEEDKEGREGEKKISILLL